MSRQYTLRKTRIGIALLSIVLFSIACARPAVGHYNFKSYEETEGIFLLVFGWLESEGVVPWLANFFWGVAVVLLTVNKPKLAWLFSVVGLTLASRILLPISGIVLVDGSYWWIASQIVLLIGCLVACGWTWMAELDGNEG